MEQLNTYFSSDTLHQNFLLCIFAHQDTVNHYVLDHAVGGRNVEKRNIVFLGGCKDQRRG
jgi:hypothetical protein